MGNWEVGWGGEREETKRERRRRVSRKTGIREKEESENKRNRRRSRKKERGTDGEDTMRWEGRLRGKGEIRKRVWIGEREKK